MADDRDPPPLFEDEDADNLLKEVEDEDLFASVAENTPILKQVDLADEKDEEDEKDIFADANTEVPLDSPMNTKSLDAAVEKPQEKVVYPPVMPVSSSVGASAPVASSINWDTSKGGVEPVKSRKETEKTREEIEEEESCDYFNMEITITDPVKRGDGMGAYMAYKINTKTTSPDFTSSELSVYRRFSDFLGLHEKLVEKHQMEGIIVPPAPEKSVVGMTKVKMSKEDQNNEFIEKRRAQLERFLNRTARHPVLGRDPDLIDFLQREEDLPKSSSTSALSGAGVMRLFIKVGDSIGKMAFHMTETDEWFEEKQQQIEALEHQLRKLHASIEALASYHRELAVNKGQLSRSVAMVANTEENTSLSRALSQLAEIEEKVHQLHHDQADNDFFVLSELMKDYLMLIGSVRDVFSERVKVFRQWKETETTLNKKREEKGKLELQRKLDKVPAVAQECTKLEVKVDRLKESFEVISKNIKKEIIRFEKQRVKDFKAAIVNYLEGLLNSQQQLIQHWESFLPEAQAIA